MSYIGVVNLSFLNVVFGDSGDLSPLFTITGSNSFF